jgi:anti-anti-sigma regulatory factor
MLRITTHNDPESLIFQLEGRLTGPWVRELEVCWQHALAGTRKQFIRFDLTGVTYVDAAGKEFLAARHAQGAELIAAGCLMRAVVAEISGNPDSICAEPAKEIGNPEHLTRKRGRS